MLKRLKYILSITSELWRINPISAPRGRTPSGDWLRGGALGYTFLPLSLGMYPAKDLRLGYHRPPKGG